MADPIFVVGGNRCGTTLAERLLLAHPGLTGPGFETQLFSRLVPGRAPDHPDAARRLLGAPAEALGNGDAVLRRFDAAMSALVREHGAAGWVEKTPEHLFCLDAILRRYPRARIVHVVRDGRDAVASLVASPFSLPHARRRRQRLYAAIAFWEWMTLSGLRAAAAHPERVHCVRYEALVAAPDAVLAPVLAAAGMGEDAALVAAWRSAWSALPRNSSFAGARDGVHGDGVARWRGEGALTRAELAVIELLAGATLRRLGYPPSGLAPPVTALARARARAGEGAWIALRLARQRRNTGARPTLRDVPLVREALTVAV